MIERLDVVEGRIGTGREGVGGRFGGVSAVEADGKWNGERGIRDKTTNETVDATFMSESSRKRAATVERKPS